MQKTYNYNLNHLIKGPLIPTKLLPTSPNCAKSACLSAPGPKCNKKSIEPKLWRINLVACPVSGPEDGDRYGARPPKPAGADHPYGGGGQLGAAGGRHGHPDGAGRHSGDERRKDQYPGEGAGASRARVAKD